MASARYTVLLERIEHLRKHLLPAVFSETGLYADDDEVAIKTLSFRVLTHAEIESFLEDRVIEIAKLALQEWKGRKLVSRVLLGLLAFSGQEMKKPPVCLAPPNSNKAKIWSEVISSNSRLEKSVSGFVRAVQHDNHGIRESNLLSILLPVGMESTELDPTLVADLDSFGRSRGEAAHSSTSGSRVRQSLDPKDEYRRVLELISGMRAIDHRLDELLADAGGAQV